MGASPRSKVQGPKSSRAATAWLHREADGLGFATVTSWVSPSSVLYQNRCGPKTPTSVLYLPGAGHDGHCSDDQITEATSIVKRASHVEFLQDNAAQLNLSVE